MKTTADCYMALLSGKKLIYADSSEFTYLRDGNQFSKSKHREALSTYSFSEPEQWSIYEEPTHKCAPSSWRKGSGNITVLAHESGGIVFACSICGKKLKAGWSVDET